MSTFVDQLAHHTGVTPNLIWMLVAVFGLLAFGSAVRAANIFLLARGDASADLSSLAIWWIFFTILIALLLSPPEITLIVFAAVGITGMTEYRKLVARNGFSFAWHVLAALVAVQYVAIAWLPAPVIWLFGPNVWLAAGALLALTRASGGDFLACWQRFSLGALLIAYLPSFAPQLLLIAPERNPVAGSAGFFLFLMLLTGLNDIAQAVAGRRFGKLKSAPYISPHKTWEGYVCGCMVTVLFSVPASILLLPIVGPWVALPFGAVWSPIWAAVALGVCIAGNFGDLIISAIKRQAGVKDSSRLFMRQGGILDRFDSLFLAAPLYYLILYAIVP